MNVNASVSTQLQGPAAYENVYSPATSNQAQSIRSQNQSAPAKSSPSVPVESDLAALSPAASADNNVPVQTHNDNVKPVQTTAVQTKPSNNPAPRPKTDTVQLSEPAQAEALHQLGLTVLSIANRLGISPSDVYGYLKIPNTETPLTAFHSLSATATQNISS